jgi:hypothetical protein
MVKKGDIAVCGLGCLGLITNDSMQEIIYKDGNRGMAYIGIHLTNKIVPMGAEWSSRNPVIVGHIDDINTFMKHFKK